MKKSWISICIFFAACMLLLSLKVMGGADGFSELVKNEDERYHPNGSEPVYVGIFGE